SDDRGRAARPPGAGAPGLPARGVSAGTLPCPWRDAGNPAVRAAAARVGRPPGWRLRRGKDSRWSGMNAPEATSVRRAEPADAAAIRALLRSVTPLVVPDPAAPGAAGFLESFEEPAVMERLASPDYLHFVAERGGDFCGYIATRGGSHLYHLFVRPDLH